jgi:hypothetical protein
MVPSCAGAAGSAGVAAEPVAEPVNEKHNSKASPVVRDSSLRMGIAPQERFDQDERRLYPVLKT